MICPKCGKRNEEGEILCCECGAKLSGSAQIFSRSVNSERKQDPATEGESGNPADVDGSEAMAYPELPAALQPETTDVAVLQERPETTDVALLPEQPDDGDIVKITDLQEITGLSELSGRFAGKTARFKVLVCAVIVVLLVVAISMIRRAGTPNLRTPMKISKVVGTAWTLSEEGRKADAVKDTALQAGDSIKTDSDEARVVVSLGEGKSLTLLKVSEATFDQEAESICITLTKGALFFDLASPFQSSASLQVGTATVMTQTRDASGYVYHNGKGYAEIYVTSGEADIYGFEDGTGEPKTVSLEAGEYVIVRTGEDGLTIQKDECIEANLPRYAVLEIQRDHELRDKVVKETGWDAEYIQELADYYNTVIRLESIMGPFLPTIEMPEKPVLGEPILKEADPNEQEPDTQSTDTQTPDS